MKAKALGTVALLLGCALGGITWLIDGRSARAAQPENENENKDANSPKAVQALIETLKDKDVEVRKNAVLALGRIGKGGKAAVSALRNALEDDDVDVRGAAALALGRM